MPFGPDSLLVVFDNDRDGAVGLLAHLRRGRRRHIAPESRSDGKGALMKRILCMCAAGMTALLLSLPAAQAAAPTTLDPAVPAGPAPAYELEIVLSVHNWVLCVSQPSAETMARAQDESVAAAQKAYSELAHAKTCGRLAKLDVLLHKQLYPVFKVEQTARVFEASVNFGVGWQDAFVVSGELANSR